MNYTDLSEELKENCKKLLQSLDKQKEQTDRVCLQKIQAVVKNCSKDDFEAMEEIVEIMIEYGWSVGSRHDFG